MHSDAFECCAFERITHNAFECIRMLINRHSSASWGHVCHDSSICVPWLIHMCAIVRWWPCVCHDPACDIVCDVTHSWLVYERMARWRDVFTCNVTYSRVTWLARVCESVCDVTPSWHAFELMEGWHSCVWLDSHTESSHVWLDRVKSHMWQSHVTRVKELTLSSHVCWLCQQSQVTESSHVWLDSVTCVIWQSQVTHDSTESWQSQVMCDLTESTLCVKSCVTWLCVLTQSQVTCVTWLCQVMCDLTLSHVWLDSDMWQSQVTHDLTESTWQSQVMCDLPESSHTHDLTLCQDTESSHTWLERVKWHKWQSQVTHDLTLWLDSVDRVKSHIWLDSACECHMSHMLTESSHTHDLTLCQDAESSHTWLDTQSQVTHRTWLSSHWVCDLTLCVWRCVWRDLFTSLMRTDGEVTWRIHVWHDSLVCVSLCVWLDVFVSHIWVDDGVIFIVYVWHDP